HVLPRRHAAVPVDRTRTTPPEVYAAHCVRCPGWDAQVTVTDCDGAGDGAGCCACTGMDPRTNTPMSIGRALRTEDDIGPRRAGPVPSHACARAAQISR